MFGKQIDVKETKVREEKNPHKAWSVQQIIGFIAKLDSIKDKVIIVLLYELGMRFSELGNLRKSKIIFSNNQKEVRLTWYAQKNKKTRNGVIKSPFSVKIIKEYLATLDDDILFKENMDSLNSQFNRKLKTLEKGLKTHDF